MKRRFINIFLIFCLPLVIKAQFGDSNNTFRASLHLGINFGQIDGDGPAGYSFTGLNGGIGIAAKVQKHMSLNLDMMYSMRGSKATLEWDRPELYSFNTRMDYIEFPLYLSVEDNDLAALYIGLMPAFLVSHTWDYRSFDPDGNPIDPLTPSCISEDPINYDLSWLAGFRLKLGKKTSVDVRYSYSLISLRDGCEGRSRIDKQLHRLITLRGIYHL